MEELEGPDDTQRVTYIPVHLPECPTWFVIVGHTWISETKLLTTAQPVYLFEFLPLYCSFLTALWRKGPLNYQVGL